MHLSRERLSVTQHYIFAFRSTMSSSPESSDGGDRSSYFDEFTCEKCGELGYKRPGNERTTCNPC